MPDEIKTEETKVEETKVEEPEVETTEEVEETEEETEEEEEEEEEVSDEDKTHALNLYRALKNPSSAKAVIEEMARSAGILGQTQKDATRTVADIVADALGDDYKFLAPKLLPAIQAVVKAEMKGLEQKVEQDKLRQAEKDIDDAIAQVNKITKGDFNRHKESIAKMMDEVKPSDKTSMKTYLMRVYTLVKQDDTRRAARVEKTKKISTNAADLGSRASRAGISGDVSTTKSKMSLEESVNAALAKLNKG